MLVNVRKAICLLGVCLVVVVASYAQGDDHAALWECDTLTGGFFGLTDALEDVGISLGLSTTCVFQINTEGGLSTNTTSGRFSGSYDLELEFDLEKLINLPGGTIVSVAQGSYCDGISDASVGSLFGVNGDAAGDRSIDLAELWYEQALLEETFRLRVGKLCLTGGFECRGCPVAFDGNSFANDETAQFLNDALINNPTIPFPDNGLGIAAYWNPAEWWYCGLGVADAQADVRETGFNTAFHDEDFFFYVFETGVVPALQTDTGELVGSYRFGVWHDPQDKANVRTGRTMRDDVGFYMSFDQMLVRETNDLEDAQGLGAFLRYGLARSDIEENPVSDFWSLGVQYLGLIPDRDEDVAALGVAHGLFADRPDISASHETVIEAYYNARLTPWLAVSPDLQVIFSPADDAADDDAVVLGLRLQMAI